jgi:hypothetical protein
VGLGSVVVVRRRRAGEAVEGAEAW